MSAGLFTFALCATHNPARGQSFNIDFGTPGTTPSSSYAAAGEAGLWNNITGGSGTYPLLDLNGNVTGVSISNNFDFFESPFNNPQPATAGDPDAAALLDDFFILEGDVLSEFFITGLQDGIYDLIVYGVWVGMPDKPTAITWLSNDLSDFQEDVTGDGPFTGLEQGLTHGTFRVEVTDNTLYFTANGIFNMQSASLGNLNGVQVVMVPAPGALAMLSVTAFARRRRRR